MFLQSLPRLLVLVSMLTLIVSASIDAAEKPYIIFDTDMDTDCDDVGALAMLHALADKGEVTILATPVSSKFPYSVPCTEAINNYYGRGDLPIGCPKGDGAGIKRGSKYAQQIADAYPTQYKTNDDAPNAVTVYRKVLAAQADASVTILTVGYLTNLRDLLASKPDGISDLSGAELVKRKVTLWVCMGGRYPKHDDPRKFGNFKPDAESAVIAVRDWPTPIVFSGLGGEETLLTGQTLDTTPKENPVRKAYKLFLGTKPARQSADLITVLYAVRPDANYWKLHETGYNHIFNNGTNEWRDKPDNPTQHLLLLQDGVIDKVRDIMNELLTRPPMRN